MLRERRDLTPVGGGRLLRPIEARQEVAAQIVRSLQSPDTELRRASLRLLDRPQRRIELTGGPLDVGEQQQRRRLAVAALKGGPHVLLRGVEASLFERDPGEELVRFAGMGREGEAGMGCGRGGLAVLEIGEAQGEREIRREALGVSHRRPIDLDRFVVAAGFHQDLSQLRPHVQELRVLLQQAPQGRDRLIQPALVRQAERRLDASEVLDLVARVRQRPWTALARRSHVSQSGQVPGLLRVDLADRRGRCGIGLHLLVAAVTPPGARS